MRTMSRQKSDDSRADGSSPHNELDDFAGGIRLVSRLTKASASAALGRSGVLGPPNSSGFVLQLQQQYGNRYVQQMVDSARSESREKPAMPSVQSTIEHLRGNGQDLDATVQAEMEPVLGIDLSRVKIHTGNEAQLLNRALHASAFTTGRDIFFSDGAYSSATPSGRELLAHELTHVGQQSGETTQGSPVINEPGDACEQEADRVAASFVRGGEPPDGLRNAVQADRVDDEPRQKSPGAGSLVGPTANRFAAAVPSKQSPGIQRQAGETVAAFGVGEALTAVGILQSQVSAKSGGLTYDSDQITYPEELKMTGNAVSQSCGAAHFFSAGALFDNDTEFWVFGDFDASPKNPILANVRLNLKRTTSYSESSLSFSAKALKTAFGTPDDPKIRFECFGRFDPAGPGDCSYRAVIEVDKWCTVKCVGSEITNGNGKLTGYDVNGFGLIV